GILAAGKWYHTGDTTPSTDCKSGITRVIPSAEFVQIKIQMIMYLCYPPPLRVYYAGLTSRSEFRILIMRIFRIFLFFILCAIFALVNAVHKILSNIFAHTRRCPMTFGEKLRRARKEKGLTQAELAN